MKVSPYIFILIKQGGFILWNYKLHEQFEVTVEYLTELQRLDIGLPPLDKKIFSKLVENNIIIPSSDENHSSNTWQWDELSKIFHIGTQGIHQKNDNVHISPKKYSKKYLEECKEIFSRSSFPNTEKSGEIINLPKKHSAKLQNAKFINTLNARCTSRNFNGRAMTIRDLSILLNLTFSDTTRDIKYYHSKKLKRIGERKTSPSGGGLHPAEAYVFSQNITGLKKGIYYFDSKKDHLVKIKNLNKKFAIGNLLNNQYFSNNLSAGIFITSNFEKIWWKYKNSRAYRIALLDIGHLSQTLLLTATALGLSTWISGAFRDEEISELLNINQISEQPILFLGFGYGNNKPIDSETLKILKNLKEYE